MLLLPKYNKPYWAAIIVFLLCGLLAITQRQISYMAIPFAWLALPLLFNIITANTAWLFWLMIALLPLSGEVNITPSLGLDFPDEPIMMLITGAFLLKILVQPSFFPTTCLRSSLFFCIILHLFWAGISSIFAVNSLLSIKFLLAKSWYIIPFVILPVHLLQTQRQFKNFALCLLLPMLFVVLQCLCRHALLGFSFEGIKASLSPYFRNHVTYSSMLVCLLVVGWATLRLTPKTAPSYPWLKKGLWLALIALFFAYSRGAWIAFFAGYIVYYIIQRQWMKQVLVIGLIATALFIGWLCTNQHYVRFAPDYEHTIMHTQLNEHLQSTTSLKDLSNAERFYRWVAGAKMIAAKPVFGFGPNNFYSNYKKYTSDIFKTYVSNNPEHSTVHNYFLLTTLEQGIIGGLLWLILVIVMLLQIEKLYHQLQNDFYKIVAITIGIILSMILLVNIMSDMIETDKIGSLFWLCAGCIIILQQKLSEERAAIA